MAIVHSTGRGNRFKDITGQRYGKLTAIGVSGKTASKTYVWRCQCDCGGVIDVKVADLSRGFVKSCGCLLRETSARNLAIGRQSAVTTPEDCPPLPRETTHEIRHCPNRTGYAVTSNGSVFSCRKARAKSWQPLVVTHNKGGYPVVTVVGNGKGRQILVARLVAEAFIGPCPINMEICHNNGNKEDSNVSNLRWDTHKENIHDSLRHGTHTSIQKHRNAILSAEDAVAIRKLGESMKLRELAAAYKVSLPLISAVLRGRIHPDAGGPIRAKGSKWSKPIQFRQIQEGPIADSMT